MSRSGEPAGSKESIGTVFKELTKDLSTLVRSEIALAKLEVRDSFVKMGATAGFFGGAAVAAVFGLAFLLLTLVYVLAIWLPAWAAALIVTVLLFAVAGLLALLGKKKLSTLRLMPTATIESVKTDIETIKSNITQAREK